MIISKMASSSLHLVTIDTKLALSTESTLTSKKGPPQRARGHERPLACLSDSAPCNRQRLVGSRQYSTVRAASRKSTSLHREARLLSHTEKPLPGKGSSPLPCRASMELLLLACNVLLLKQDEVCSKLVLSWNKTSTPPRERSVLTSLTTHIQASSSMPKPA